MSTILSLKTLSRSQIDFDNFSYSISPERDVSPGESLIRSIARHGILHPPIVRKISPDSYAIVAGRKRLLGFYSLHAESTCACLCISRRIPEVDVFSILLDEIQLTRQLSAVEKAIFLQKITAIVDERQIVGEFLPRLGFAPHSFAIKQSLALLNLEAPILRSIQHGRINETVAHGLLGLSAQDRMALFAILASLRLSSSYQKKLLHMCRELAGRNDTSIAALLDNDEVRGILNHQEANPPQKTKNLMLWLSRSQMPRYSEAAEQFKRFVTAMHLPQNVSVDHTPFFEDDALTLSITFTNRKSLQHAWEKMRHAVHSSDN